MRTRRERLDDGSRSTASARRIRKEEKEATAGSRVCIRKDNMYVARRRTRVDNKMLMPRADRRRRFRAKFLDGAGSPARSFRSAVKGKSPRLYKREPPR